MDIQKIPAIQQKRIVTFVNHFIINTVTLLNKFIESFENSLWELEKRMRKLETALKLLEIKLNFIPNTEQQFGSNASTSDDVKHKEPIEVTSEAPKGDLPVDETYVETIEEQVKDIPEEVQKYIKMYHVGVPLQAVKLKMQMDGVNPDLLNSYY